MLQAERRNHIIELLNRDGKVVIEDLARILEVSEMTIRRDLQHLEEHKLITRTHGGAVLHNLLTKEIPYTKKAEQNIEEKQRIGMYASSLVKEGDIIILDAGTTNMEIAKGIVDIKNLKIITNDLMIGAFLSKYDGIEVYCTGGIIQRDTGACLGNTTIEFLQNINADIAFVGASAIDIQKGITTPTMDKAQWKKEIIKCAERAILVADSLKFGKVSFAKICSLSRLDLIITDTGIDDEIRQEFKNLDVEVKLV
ncbi:DeoR/GlpR family DNA-binding transcription regulator [Alkaliphilus sp. MSJ-5]|uniref:DeoR/GlpR family DNA-binding transcription regulator n=1 Tax=Alkaliphilus flagellatus TaxID=2841507 RepID=A0ABS6G2B5_9FIRM|nr:DeoR/GlpR family DNA-binding transcription regulator [Alkaliphilus flagellatus]MBU5676615.1 DeoR/GlpR family DNA-binding transcription regulator [Alkaliphilus flagellatus]